MLVTKSDLKDLFFSDLNDSSRYTLVDSELLQIIAITPNLMVAQGLVVNFPNAQIEFLSFNFKEWIKTDKGYLFMEDQKNPAHRKAILKDSGEMDDGFLEIVKAKLAVLEDAYKIYRSMLVDDIAFEDGVTHALEYALYSSNPEEKRFHKSIEAYAEIVGVTSATAYNDLNILFRGRVHKYLQAIGYWRREVNKLSKASFMKQIEPAGLPVMNDVR